MSRGALAAAAPALIVLVVAAFPMAPGLAVTQAGPPDSSTLDRDNLPQPGAEAAVATVHPGSPFPAFEVSALRPGAREPGLLRLGEDLGKRPILLFYLKIGHGISEEIYLEVQDFVASELADRVALYPVVLLGGAYEVTELRERIGLLGIARPVLLDEDRRIQKSLGMRWMPHIGLIHSDGNLAFSGARSLGHPVHGEISLAEAIRMSARGERPPTKEVYKHFPAVDLVGRKYVDMELPEYDSSGSVRISRLIEPGKLTAIFYWSPSCRWSRNALTGLQVAVKAYTPKYLNLVTVVRDGGRDEIRSVAEEHGFKASILRNRDRRFTTKYRVMSTPTLIIVRPDGIIDSVFTDGTINYFSVINTKLNRLIIAPAAPSPTAPSSR